jgi:fatty acid-binding protein DegV
MMSDLIAETVGEGSRIKVAFMHAAASAEVRKLKALVEDRFDCVEPFVTELNPALGVHTGPGLVGLSFYPL